MHMIYCSPILSALPVFTHLFNLQVSPGGVYDHHFPQNTEAQRLTQLA